MWRLPASWGGWVTKVGGFAPEPPPGRAALDWLPGVGFFAFACVLVQPALAATAYLRFNQLGAETGQPARAYLVTSAPIGPATFKIGTQTGTVGASTGSWGAYTIYPIDFTVGTPGRYKMTISGGLSLVSDQFTVGDPRALYQRALSNSLAFFQNQRDGADVIQSTLRSAPAHLNDSRATVFSTPVLTKSGLIAGPLAPTGETIDASGGWWDAGDYLKFVETHSYTAGVLLTGVRDFPDQMGPGSAADFTGEAKFGLRWLQRMWNDQTSTLYYEVGIGIDFAGQPTLSDHDLWRLPQVDDTLGGTDPASQYIRHRPVFAAGPAGAPISPNLAGRLAADFALCFIDFRTTDLAFAQACLQSAEHIFALADTSPKRLLTALPYGFYPETEWRDDLEWGATELSLALMLGGRALPAHLPHADAAYYLSQAAHWARAYIAGPNDAADTLNLYDVSGLAHFDLIRALDLAGNPSGLAVTQADLRSDLARQLAHAAAQATSDPFGFGFPWATSDTASHGDGLSVLASQYAYLSGDGTWTVAARRWMGNVLGANVWGAAFLIGDGSNFVDCPQHQVANLAGSLAGGRPVLAGAVVEGPNAAGAVAHGTLSGMRACPGHGADRYAMFTGNGARFRDSVENYASTEPAIDLTATSPLMFAWRMAVAPAPLIR